MTRGDTVLVVDDDAVSRTVLARALVGAGFEAEVVGSGGQALTWLAEHTPSVILLDLVMPPPDGYVVLRSVRRDRRTAEVPVVVLTALDKDEEVARAFELGADDFIRKPFRPVELVARVRGQIRMRDYVVALARKEHDAKVILELTQALSSALDIREILFTVVRRIADVAQIDRCSIILVREQGDVGYVVASSDDKDLRDLPLDLSKYPEIQQVLGTGEVLVIDDARSSPIFDLVRTILPPDSFRSLAILPLLFEDKAMGVLFLRGRRPVALREHELSLARTVAGATAIALRNARILQSLRDQTQQISFARFEAERRLAALQPYADFFHSAADGIIVIDPDGRILFSNPRAQAITCRTDSELSSMTLAGLIDPRDRALLDDLRGGFGRGVFPHTVDLTIQRCDENQCERRVLSCSFSSVLREDGGAILINFHDVTSERATEAELTKTKEFLERVIESSVDAIISADMNGVVLLFNRAAERIYGYTSAEVVGLKTLHDLYPDGSATQIMRLIQSGDHGGPGRLEGYRTEVLAKDGTRIPMMLSAALIVEGGRPTGSVGIFTDLRELVRMETQLTAAQEELRTREKQALIAELAGATAHELNQPLTSVLGYAEMILRRVDATSPAQAAAATIRAEAERMAEIVRKIGKITRYETKSYVGSAKIIDLDRSSGNDDGSSNSSGSAQ
ncbi:PAS domain S-box protein [Chondromyces crocatus]|uniref:histidine kinase n=1 Tax=Chondromyces crocatus TaxID=52 RepID=A0A0K1EQZ8_CHOCO|nr:PAS domain S-box protein [Chondromyces crocatus]AKT43360.1 histidine kinase [Chondromyces crocatus]